MDQVIKNIAYNFLMQVHDLHFLHNNILQSIVLQQNKTREGRGKRGRKGKKGREKLPFRPQNFGLLKYALKRYA